MPVRKGAHTAGVVVKPIGGDFRNSGYQYNTIRTNVDMLKMIQLGLTFCNEAGELPKHNGELCVWQFNFREFNPRKDMYAPESIKLLVDSGIDFDANVERGVDQAHFAELLMTSSVVLNEDVQWITFHSGYDFGCAAAARTRDYRRGTAPAYPTPSSRPRRAGHA